MIRHYCDRCGRLVRKDTGKDDYIVVATREGNFTNGVLDYMGGEWLLCADCASRFAQEFEVEER